MSNSTKGTDNRIKWVDLTKCIACLIVLTGHLLQGLVKAGIMQDSFGYGYANRMMYHVNIALFLICSGYLYQKYCDIDSFKDYLRNLGNKAIRLLVPYVFFVTLSWGIKYLLRDDVNTQVDSLFHELVTKPMSPYWFLPALFVMFIIVPVIKGRWTLLLVNIEAIAIYVLIDTGHNVPYAVTLLTFIIWFVIGMDVAYLNLDKGVNAKEDKSNTLQAVISLLLLIAFFIIGLIEYKINPKSEILHFIIPLLGCSGIVGLDMIISHKVNPSMLANCGTYVMPIYLMHTIFSAAARICLLHVGTTSLLLHLLAGLIIGIVGPVVTYEIWNVIKKCVRQQKHFMKIE